MQNESCSQTNKINDNKLLQALLYLLLYILISVVSDVEGFIGLFASSTLVFTELGFTVGLSSSLEDFLSLLDVFFLTIPGLDARVLKGSSVREGETPRSLDGGQLVHGVEVQSGFFFTLTTGQEHDTGDSRRDGSAQSSDSQFSDFSGADAGSVGESGTRGDHVGLQEDTFKINVVISEGLEDSSINSLGGLEADANVVFTVREDFGFDDGDETVGLADSSISGKTPSVFLDGGFRGAAVRGDLEDSSPFSESATNVVEFLGSLGEVVETESGGFFVSSGDDGGTLVELNTGEDTLFLQEINELLAVLGGLLGGFFVEDDTRDVLFEIGGSEEEFSVSSSVFFVVFELDVVESLSDGTGGFISSEDTETTSGDSFGVFLKFSTEIFSLHVY